MGQGVQREGLLCTLDTYLVCIIFIKSVNNIAKGLYCSTTNLYCKTYCNILTTHDYIQYSHWGQFDQLRRPGWLSRMPVRLMIGRPDVQSHLGPTAFCGGDWLWNIFSAHSLPFADSRLSSCHVPSKECAQVHVPVNSLEHQVCPGKVWLGKLTGSWCPL